jgi:NADP-dependent 3-hydroxy acid dehydrogenase YdfG
MSANGHVLDVADKEGMHAWADKLLGRGHVDIVINNAGVALIQRLKPAIMKTSSG